MGNSIDSEQPTMLPSPPRQRRRQQRHRSLTDSSILFSLCNVTIDEGKRSVEHELLVRDDDACSSSGTFMRRTCTKSYAPEVSTTSRRENERTTLLRRSVSCPGNLNQGLMRCCDNSVKSNKMGAPFLVLLAEKNRSVATTTASIVSSDESTLTTTTTSSNSYEDVSPINASPSTDSLEEESPVRQNKIIQEVARISATSSSLSVPLGSSVTVTVKKGRSTCSLADLIRSQRWDNLERKIELAPELISQPISMHCQGEKTVGQLLHLACSDRDTPLTVVDSLVTAFPPSVSITDTKQSRLPLHMACLKGSSHGIVRYLARAMPVCLVAQDAQGNVPLHYASMCGTDKMLNVLLDDQYAASCCQVANNKLKLPLHILCARWVDNHCSGGGAVSIDLIKTMIEAYPRAVTAPDHMGRLPLHVACNMANPRLDVIRLLLGYKPETVLYRDQEGNTPLQLAKRFSGRDRDGDLGVLYLQEVYAAEKQKQNRRKAKRMARRFLHFGRARNSNYSTLCLEDCNRDSHALAKLFNC